MDFMIRVLIERRLAAGQQAALNAKLIDLRRGAMHTEGYVSGETLRDTGDPTRYVVLSTWTSRVHWERWYASDARRERDADLLPLLAEPETITILEHI